MEEVTGGGVECEEPRADDLASWLCDVWSNLLGGLVVGPDDDYFALGGDSLTALRITSRLRERWGAAVGLKTIVEARTPRALAAAARAALAANPSDARGAGLAGEADDSPAAPFPLTPVQQAYWLGRSAAFDLGARGTASYVEVDAPDIDLDRLRRAVDTLVARHAMLRAVLLPDGTQTILSNVGTYPVEIEDRRDDHDDTYLAAKRQRLATSDIDPYTWPLFRLGVTLLPGKVRVHLLMELLICDGTSLRILLRELAALYRDPDAALPPLGYGFDRYTRALAAMRSSDDFDRSRSYWRGRLGTFAPPPDLPLAREPSTIERPVFHRRVRQLEAPRWARLKERAAQRGVTSTSVTCVAYAAALVSLARSPRFTLNVTTYRRVPLHLDVDRIVGDFTSITLLEIDARAARFEEGVRRTQARLWEDMDHSLYSGIDVIRDLRRRDGDAKGAPMPVVFTSALGHREEVADEAVWQWLGEGVFGAAGTPQVWIDNQVNEHAGALEVRWDSVDALFHAGMVDDLFEDYVKRLEALADSESAWVEPIERRVPSAQLARRVAVHRGLPPPRESTLPAAFVEALTREPDAIACVDAERAWSRRQLAVAADQCAAALAALGVRPGARIGVALEKGARQAIALLGIGKLGSAYVPLAPASPRERLAALSQAAEVELILAEDGAALDVPGARIVRWSDLPDAPEAQGGAAPDDLAYVIFTSGSTGVPKGVMIEHRAVLNTIDDINRRFGVGPGDRVIALSDLGFDLSVYDSFGVLAAGATIVYPRPAAAPDPEGWVACLAGQRVTVWSSVPALMVLLVEHHEATGAPPDHALRLVMLSGDWLPLDLVPRIRACFPCARIVNLGGATEASIWSVFHEITEIDPTWRSVPYGRPLANQTVHVLDEDLRDVPDWVTGELYIGGAGVARGYCGDAELTARRFIVHPMTGERLHRTGDLARWRADATLELLGRTDDQVKIRGYRVDPREIEFALSRHPDVAAAAVVATGAPLRLVAYVVEAASSVPAAPQGMDRLRFLLEDRGRRRFSSSRDVVVLDASLPPDRWAVRRTCRRFRAEPIPLATISAWLEPLRAVEVPGAPLPRYRYPSAGTLYPVQVYLSVAPGGVAGLRPGIWYHDRREHTLVAVHDAEVPLQAHDPVNHPTVRDAGCVVFLVGAIDAIAPVYGDLAVPFALLEAGYMSQLLVDGAAERGLGACPIGTVDFNLVRGRFHVMDDAHFLHALAAGLPNSEEVEANVDETAGRRDGSTLRSDALRAWLHEELPKHLAHIEIRRLAALPLTPSGKVDRAALKRLASAPVAADAHVAPRTDLERRIAAIWQATLGVDRVGVDDNFFDLGGDSLLLVRLHRQLVDEIALTLKLEEIFELATVRRLAEQAGGARRDADAHRGQERLRRRSERRRPVAPSRKDPTQERSDDDE